MKFFESIIKFLFALDLFGNVFIQCISLKYSNFLLINRFSSKGFPIDLPFDQFINIKNSFNGKCIKATKEYENIIQIDCNSNDDDQLWKILKNVSINFQNKKYSHLMIDNQWIKMDDGNPYWAYPANQNVAQKFNIEKIGEGYTIQNHGSKKCLQIQNENAPNNKEVVQWSCNKEKNQIWKFESLTNNPFNDYINIKNSLNGKCIKVIGDYKNILQVDCNPNDDEQL